MRPSAFLHTVLPLLAVAVLHSAAQAAAPGASVVIDLGEPAVRSRTVAFGPTAAPQSFTVGCAPGEQLLSGGYGDADPEVRVLASHPTDDQGVPVAAGSQPRAWTVTALGLRQSAGSLRVSALCLAGGEVTAAAFAGPPADGLPDPPPAECPSGMVRSGGGYATAWQARLGAAVVSGSHPVGERGWAVDAALTRGQAALRASNWATAYAVCLTGPVQPVAVEDVSFNLDTLARECVPGIATSVCLVPRLGVATAHCPPGALASGGGFRAGDTAAQRQYLVAEDGPSAYATWTVRISAYTTDAAPAPMRLTPVCLFPVAAPDAPVGDLLPDSGASRNQALTIVGLLALLLLALLAVLALRRGRRRPTPVGGIEVVVRTVRTRYRTDQYREDA